MDLALLNAGSPWAPMAAGLVFGAVHACDADHVLTVTSISRNAQASRGMVLGYGARWACGHALALIGIGTALAGLGWKFPWVLGAAAEIAVACALVVLGAYLLCGAVRGGRPVWHNPRKLRGHGVFGLGLLHGLAGAAPVMALMPLSQRLDPWLSCAYLACFSLGVILAMLCIAAFLSSANEHVRRRGVTLERAVNAAIGIGACVVGLHIITAVIE